MSAQKYQEGPAESYDDAWRTTTSHTSKQMMSVYREIFFAGFPGPTTRGGESSDDASLVVFPPALVREMFSRFGNITSFHFDVTRGVGAVTFEDGEDAERCYITAHLSMMRGASGGGDQHHSTGDGSRDRSGALEGVFGKHAALVFLEFAQWLPFVNPLLLERSVAALTSMNRQLLRTFPVCERRHTTSTAMWIVYECKHGPVDAHSEQISLPGHGVGAINLPIATAMVQTLFPPGAAKEHTVTILDLWSQYYDQFVVNKTQPDASRISTPNLIFASKKSCVQDVVAYCRDAVQGGVEGRMKLARLAEDDVLHSTMSYIAFKLRMINDPSCVSFLRAIDVRYQKSAGKLATGSGKATTTASIVGGSVRNELLAGVGGGSDDSEKVLLGLSLVDAASNVIENAVYMMGRYNRKARDAEDAQEQQFQCVLGLFDAYAASGSASTIASICCRPEVFRGPEGLPAKIPTTKNVLWRTFRIPLLMTAVVMLGLWILIQTGRS